MAPLLSVVIPTYNEAANIGPLLGDLRRAMAGLDVEFVVVDDDSKDGTSEKARMAEPTARIIVRKGERGLATAVVRGIREARGTFVAVMDADFQHPPATVRAMLDKAVATQADLVVGSRYADGGSEGNFGLARRTISKGARTIATVVLPPVRRFKLTDPMSGLFLVRRDRVDPAQLRPSGYKILLEVIGKSDLRRVEEVGYRFQDRRGGASKLGSTVILQYLTHVLTLGLQQKENQRLLRFLLVGASGVAVNLGFLFAFVELAGMEKTLAVIFAAEISILTNFFLNDSFTFRDEHRAPFFARLGMFQLVSLSGLIANFLAFFVLYYLLGVHYLVAEALAIVFAFTINYLGNLNFTYSSKRPAVRTWLPIVVLVVASSGLYFTALDSVPDYYFDESYYLAVAHQMDNGVLMDPCHDNNPNEQLWPLNYEHPPLAKLILYASVHAYDSYHGVFLGCRDPDSNNTSATPCFVEGNTTASVGKECFADWGKSMRGLGNQYAWRAPSALFGVMTVVFAALAARRLFQSNLAGVLAGSFVLMDNLVLTSSRIALLDIFATGFMVVAVFFATFPTRKGVVFSALFLGLGFSCKFYVLFAGPPVLLLSLWTHYNAGVLRKRRFDLHALAFPLIPAGVLLATYTPWWILWTRAKGFGWALGHFIAIQAAAFKWDTSGTQTHQYLSPPSEWLAMVTPMNYINSYTTYTNPDGSTYTMYRDIYAMGNPAMWWFAALAVCAIIFGLAVALARKIAVPAPTPPAPPFAATPTPMVGTVGLRATSASTATAPATFTPPLPAATLTPPQESRPQPMRPAQVATACLAFAVAAISLLSAAAQFNAVPPDYVFAPGAPGGPAAVPVLSVIVALCETLLGIALLNGLAWARPTQVMLSAFLILLDIALMVQSGGGIGIGLLLLFAAHAALLGILAGRAYLRLPRAQQALLPGALLPLMTYLGFFALHSGGRSMFIFYMTVIVPLMAIALGGAVAFLWRSSRGGRIAGIAIVAIVALAFLWFLPLTLYLELPRDLGPGQYFVWRQLEGTPIYYPAFPFHRIMEVVPWMHECGNKIVDGLHRCAP